MRHRALLRVLAVRQQLAAGRCTLRSLAAQFGVTTRTIRRDVDVLRLAGERVRGVPRRR